MTILMREQEITEESKEESKFERSIEIAKNLLDILGDTTIALNTGLSMKKLRN